MKKIRSIWSFITRRKAGTTSAPTNPPASPSGSWYSTLDLPLNLFRRCLVDSDLSALLITGQPAEYVLYSAWEAVYELFLDAMKDKDGLYKVRLLGRINMLQFRYDNIQLCIAFLRKAYHPAVDTALRQWVRVDGILNPDNKVFYLQLLRTAENRAQHVLIEKETLEAEKAILEKRKPGGDAITHEHLDKLIAQVSYFMKFRIVEKEVATKEFCAFYSMMRDSNDLIRQQSKRRA